MTVKPPKAMGPPAKNLKDYVGTTIQVVSHKVVTPRTGFGAGKPKTIGVLANGETVWLQEAVVNQLDPIEGTYDVYTYEKYGKTCAALRNA